MGAVACRSARRWISGKLGLWDGRRRWFIGRVMTAENPIGPRGRARYGLTEGSISAESPAPRGARKRLPPMPEWISETRWRPKLPSFTQALSAMHP